MFYQVVNDSAATSTFIRVLGTHSFSETQSLVIELHTWIEPTLHRNPNTKRRQSRLGILAAETNLPQRQLRGFRRIPVRIFQPKR